MNAHDLSILSMISDASLLALAAWVEAQLAQVPAVETGR